MSSPAMPTQRVPEPAPASSPSPHVDEGELYRRWREWIPGLTGSQPGDRYWMDRALTLARGQVGLTWPNPPVGAVVVREGRLIGQGAHPAPGKPHAEVLALEEAGAEARGATLYVTLEPCNHHGRTPPCVEAVLRAGIRRVVAAIPDPNPRVRGTGLRRLVEAGVEVTLGVGAAEATRVQEPFLALVARGHPWVVYKAGMSLDGKIATFRGDSRWITGEQAREEVHRLRCQLPAIMVGIGTVLHDDPRLTARHSDGSLRHPQPLRVVVDSAARTPPTARLLREPGETLIACSPQASDERVAALAAAGAQVVRLPATAAGQVDLTALMEELGRRQIAGVLLEGGGTLASAMLTAGLVDEVIVHVAPLLIGGRQAPGPVGGQGVARLQEAIGLFDWQVRPLGRDLELRAATRPLEERCRQYFQPPGS